MDRPTVNWTEFLAWLVAPTPDQQWEIFKTLRLKTGRIEFGVYYFWYERSPFGSLESALRSFWLNINAKH